MQVNKIAPEILMASVAMLSPFVPGLTTDKFLAALKSYNGSGASDERRVTAHPEPPYTRKGAASFLGVSLPTIDRYLAAGLLDRVRLTAHTVRNTPESVQALLKGGENNV